AVGFAPVGPLGHALLPMPLCTRPVGGLPRGSRTQPGGTLPSGLALRSTHHHHSPGPPTLRSDCPEAASRADAGPCTGGGPRTAGHRRRSRLPSPPGLDNTSRHREPPLRRLPARKAIPSHLTIFSRP
ncbi:hypothetical protein NGA_2068900, partial [Nannochloropsis gaditana CCMP526]|uniref:uncharacterized protein n=1 Tax=Nannochloropsis gaditana (strain CCMP526) TaxID=1093141 RepID=UPI00029F691B